MVPGDVISEIAGGVPKNLCTFSKTIYNEILKFNVEMSQMMILLETLRIHRSVNKSDILEILGESGWPGGVRLLLCEEHRTCKYELRARLQKTVNLFLLTTRSVYIKNPCFKSTCGNR